MCEFFSRMSPDERRAYLEGVAKEVKEIMERPEGKGESKANEMCARYLRKHHDLPRPVVDRFRKMVGLPGIDDE